MVTQVQIAELCRLDVSSVNKVLNGVPGPVFKRSTIRRVFATAKRMGWKPRARDKWPLLRRIADILNDEHTGDAEKVSAMRGVMVAALGRSR